MSFKHYLSFLLLLVIFMGFSSVIASEHNKIFPGEKEIEFKNDGQSVKAYEGTIQVLENRKKPSSRKIPLTYVRFPATANHGASPIIYLSGGPGGSGISTAQYPGFRFPLFMALREFGDVIALDQRGTGKSKTVPKCTSDNRMSLSKKITQDELRELYRNAAKHCVSFWEQEGVDVFGYNSIQSAMDINQLRQHLKAEKVTLWGISYGSHLAFTSLKVMPDNIEKIVIASAEGLDQTVKLPMRTDAYFSRLQLAINQQPESKKVYPDIKLLIQRVHAQLKSKPIKLKLPQKDGTSIDFLFQYFHMQGLAGGMIADPQRGVPRLLGMYQALDQGHHEFLPQIIKRAGFDNDRISFDVMSFGMDIASGMTQSRQRLVSEQAKTSLLGAMLNFPMPQLNKIVEGIDLGDEFRSFPKSSVPTLLLTGTLDGRTYIEAQKDATKGLTNLTQVTIENAGHNLFMLTPEVTEVIKLFLKDEKISTNNIRVTLPPFVK